MELIHHLVHDRYEWEKYQEDLAKLRQRNAKAYFVSEIDYIASNRHSAMHEKHDILAKL